MIVEERGECNGRSKFLELPEDRVYRPWAEFD